MATLHQSSGTWPIVVAAVQTARPPGAQTQPGAQALGVRLVEHSHSVLRLHAMHCYALGAGRRKGAGGTECAQRPSRQCDDANTSRHTGTDVHRIGERVSRRSASASAMRRQRCHRHLQARTHRLVTAGCTRRRSAGDSALVCCRAWPWPPSQSGDASQDPTVPHTTTASKFFGHCPRAHDNDRRQSWNASRRIRTHARTCHCASYADIAWDQELGCCRALARSLSASTPCTLQRVGPP